MLLHCVMIGANALIQVKWLPVRHFLPAKALTASCQLTHEILLREGMQRSGRCAP
jgi:hypothetical protein